jgi:hypothetical protein
MKKVTFCGIVICLMTFLLLGNYTNSQAQVVPDSIPILEEETPFSDPINDGIESADSTLEAQVDSTLEVLEDLPDTTTLFDAVTTADSMISEIQNDTSIAGELTTLDSMVQDGVDSAVANLDVLPDTTDILEIVENLDSALTEALSDTTVQAMVNEGMDSISAEINRRVTDAQNSRDSLETLAGEIQQRVMDSVEMVQGFVPDTAEIAQQISDIQDTLTLIREDLDLLNGQTSDTAMARITDLRNDIDELIQNLPTVNDILKEYLEETLDYYISVNATENGNGTASLEYVIVNNGRSFNLADLFVRTAVGGYSDFSETPFDFANIAFDPLVPTLGFDTLTNTNPFFETFQILGSSVTGEISLTLYGNNKRPKEIYETADVTNGGLGSADVSGYPVNFGDSLVIASVIVPITKSGGSVELQQTPNSGISISLPLYYARNFNEDEVVHNNLTLPDVTIVSSDADNKICVDEEVIFESNISAGNQWQLSPEGGVFADVPGETGKTFTTTALVDGDIIRVLNANHNTNVSDSNFVEFTSNEVTTNIQLITAVIDDLLEYCADNVEYTAAVELGDTYAWTIGSGAPGTDFNILSPADSSVFIVEWLNDETYPINLTVSLEGSTCVPVIALAQNQIIYAPVTATINQIDSLCVGGTEALSATVANGGVYSWTIGGVLDQDYSIVGGGVDQPTLELLWSTAGVQSVNLTVNHTQTSALSCDAAIAAPESQVVLEDATVTIDPTTDLCVDGVSEYSAAVTNGSSFTWLVTGTEGADYNFADGTTIASDTLRLEWLAAGTQAVDLTIGHAKAFDGCNDVVASQGSQLINPDATVAINTIDDLCESGQVGYIATATNEAAYAWSVGGELGADYTLVGDTSTQTLNVTWLSEGNYPINLTVTSEFTGAGCDAVSAEQASQDVYPSATAVINALDVICQTGEVMYSATVENVGAYSWLIEGADGVDYTNTTGSLDQSALALTWINSGDFTVDLNVANAVTGAGCDAVDADQLTQNVNQTLTAVINATSLICETGEATYNAVVNGDSVGAYAWTFDGVLETDYNFLNGTSAISNSPNIQWLTPTAKNVSLVVENTNSNDGCANGIGSPVTQEIAEAVSGDIVVSDPEICAGFRVTYSALQTNGDDYTWSFDGILDTDYSIASGDVFSETINITWLTKGTKNANLNLTHDNEGSSGCVAVDLLPKSIISDSVLLTLSTSNPRAILGESTEVTVTASDLTNGGFTYAWYSDEFYLEIDNDTVAVVNVSPIRDETVYTVDVTNDLGCVSVASQLIGVDYWVKVDATVLLEGPSDNGVMLANINDLLVETYGVDEGSSLPSLDVFGNQPNFQRMTSGTVPANAVDVVVVSIRNESDIEVKSDTSQSASSGRQLAWLLTDGSLVNFSNGTGDVRLFNQSLRRGGNFNVVVRHRNHLTIMSNESPLSTTSLNIDMTSISNLFNTKRSLVNFNGIYAMPAGDMDFSQSVNIIDRNAVKRDANNFESGYVNDRGESTDINLDGQVTSADVTIIDKNNAIGYFSEVPDAN